MDGCSTYVGVQFDDATVPVPGVCRARRGSGPIQLRDREQRDGGHDDERHDAKRQGRQETDLRGALRDGANDEDLAELWRKAMWGKPAGHGIDDPTFLQPVRPMSAIGG